MPFTSNSPRLLEIDESEFRINLRNAKAEIHGSRIKSTTEDISTSEGVPVI